MSIYVSAPVNLPSNQHSSGFTTRSLRPDLLGNTVLNPLISADHFQMSLPTFPPHPHAGFSAVTYMFEHSPGSFINRDSLGDRSLIKPGDLHWTLAGSGMLHEEVPQTSGVTCEGLQLFVNLSTINKLCTPQAFHTAKEDFLRISSDGIQIKILSGEESGKKAALDIPERFDFLDISIDGTPEYTTLNPAHFSTVIYCYRGSFELQVADQSIQTLTAYQAMTVTSESDLAITLKQGQGQLLLFRARQLHEPIAFGGPFIMNSREEIQQAKQRYLSGEMGRLEASF